MREYAKVSPQFWLGETGRSLRGNTTAQVVALYLMTSPHASITGVFHCPPLYIAHETGCSLQGALKALRSLSDAGFLTWDEASDTIWVHEMAKFQVGDSLSAKDKRVPWVRGEYEKMQKGRIKQGFYARYAAAYHLLPEPENTSPFQAPSKPHRSQEMEMEMEQEIEQEQDIPLSAAPTARAGSTGNRQGKKLEALAADHGTNPDDVQRVFEHWRTEWGHPKAALDEKRRKLIRLRLRDYPAETLCQAISGYLNSPHHCGQNDRATVYDAIELFLRDSAHIDAGLRFADAPPRADQSTLTRRNVAAIADWVPPELRNVAS